MDATERDVRQLSETLDFLEDLLAPGAEVGDLSEVLGGTLRECQDLRDRLQEAVPDILDRDGGEATFNQIAALLERMERVKDQWQAAQSGAGGAGAGGGQRSPPSGPSMAVAPGAQLAAPSLPASALTSAASGSVPAPVAAVPASALASASPAQSHASEDMWRQTSGLGSMEKEKEKKKKRKEGKESKEKDLGDQGKEGKGSEDGFPDSFGAWPDSGEASAFPESFGGWGTAPLGSSPAPFEASNWATGVSAEGLTTTPGPCGPCGPCASAGPSPFAAFGMPEPSAPIAPSSLLGDANAQAEGTLASLHVGFPFAAISEDKEAFERLFVRAAAAAAGVAPRRIRVHAVRPGPGY
ncbi:unnamed protein product [Symbiodinium sp. CCMP2592]|nr:unnamed protein product [Symbiodinium sp. CCMP2592]